MFVSGSNTCKSTVVVTVEVLVVVSSGVVDDGEIISAERGTCSSFCTVGIVVVVGVRAAGCRLAAGAATSATV